MQHRDVTRTLRLYAADWNDYLTIANALNHCSQEEPCGSLVCPDCGNTMWRRVAVSVRLMQAEISQRYGYVEWDFVTIVPDPYFSSAALQRSPKSLGDVKSEILGVLQEIPIPFCFGALDASWNEFFHRGAERPFEEHIAYHAHCLLPRDLRTAAEKVLRARFRASRFVQRPVHIKPFDGDDAAVGYMLERNFARRTRRVVPDKKGERFTQAHDRDLRLPQDAKLKAIFHKLALPDRLLLIGMRWNSEKETLELI